MLPILLFLLVLPRDISGVPAIEIEIKNPEHHTLLERLIQEALAEKSVSGDDDDTHDDSTSSSPFNAPKLYPRSFINIYPIHPKTPMSPIQHEHRHIIGNPLDGVMPFRPVFLRSNTRPRTPMLDQLVRMIIQDPLFKEEVHSLVLHGLNEDFEGESDEQETQSAEPDNEPQRLPELYSAILRQSQVPPISEKLNAFRNAAGPIRNAANLIKSPILDLLNTQLPHPIKQLSEFVPPNIHPFIKFLSGNVPPLLSEHRSFSLLRTPSSMVMSFQLPTTHLELVQTENEDNDNDVENISEEGEEEPSSKRSTEVIPDDSPISIKNADLSEDNDPQIDYIFSKSGSTETYTSQQEKEKEKPKEINTVPVPEEANETSKEDFITLPDSLLSF